MRNQSPSLDRHTKPTGTFVTIKSRDDIDPSSGTVAVQHSGRSVTAVPENVGLCQVIDVGPDVTNVKKGDICFIDFFDVSQGYIVQEEEIYVTQAMALRMTVDMTIEERPCPITRKPRPTVIDCKVRPLPGYVLTKHAPERMTVAVTGSDRTILPRQMTTSGIVSARDADGDPAAHVCYEEVVDFTPGAVQQERFNENYWAELRIDTYYEERRLKSRIQRLEAALREASPGHPLLDAPPSWQLNVGDLVVFSPDFSIQFRAMGELLRCTPYKNMLGTIDDAAILAEFNASNPPKPLVHILGGGPEKLYANPDPATLKRALSRRRRRAS